MSLNIKESRMFNLLPFKLFYMLFAVLSVCPFLQQYSGPFFKIVLPYGAVLLLVSLFLKKDLQQNRYFIVLVFFTFCIGFSVLMNYNKDLINNAKSVIYLIIQLFVLAQFEVNSSPEKIESQIRLLNRATIYAISVISAISFIQFVFKLNGSYEVWNAQEGAYELFYYGVGYGDRLTGITGNPNTLGILALIGLVAIFINLRLGAGKKERAFYCAAAVLNFICFIMSGSRGAELGAFAFFTCYLFFIIVPRLKRGKLFVLKNGVVILIACVISFAGLQMFPPIRNALGYVPALLEVASRPSGKDSEESFSVALKKKHVNLQRDTSETTAGNGRIFLWRAGARTIMQYPLFGVGNTKMAEYVSQVAPDIPLPGIRGGGMHNIVMQTAVSYGLISLAALAVLVFMLAKDSLCVIYRFTHSKNYMAFVAVASGVIMLFANNMVEANILYTSSFINFFFMLYLGFLMYYLNLYCVRIKKNNTEVENE